MHLFQYFRKVTTGEDLKKAKENVSIMLHTTLCLLHVLCNAHSVLVTDVHKLKSCSLTCFVFVIHF